MEENNILYDLDALENIKHIETIPKMEYLTTQMIADYYEVDVETIKTVYKRNKEELKNYTIKKSCKELKYIFTQKFMNIETYKGYFIVDDIKFSNNNNILYSKEALLNIGLFLQDSVIATKLKDKLGLPTYYSIGRKEIRFKEKLVETIKPFNYTLSFQKNVLNYRVDYYIEDLNIAIEYDENEHRNYSYEKQELRQENIEDKINCTFIRLSDKNSDEYNIGLVLKKVYDEREKKYMENMEYVKKNLRNT